MSGFIGNDVDWSGWTVQQILNRAEDQRIMHAGGQAATLIADATPGALTVGWSASSGTDSKIVVVLYDITGHTGPVTGATLVNSLECTCTAAGVNQTYAWPAVTLTSGRTYALSFAASPTPTANTAYVRRLSSTGASNRSTLTGYDQPANTWTDADPPASNYKYALKLAYTDVGGASLTDIDGDEIVVDGQSNITYSGSGLGAADDIRVTASNTAQTAVWSLTWQSGTGGTITSATRGNLPYTDANHALTAAVRDAGTDLASIGITFNPPSGFVALALSDAVAVKTVGESALAALGTIPANSQAKVPTHIGGYLVTYEISGGFWTGRLSLAGVVTGAVNVTTGEYRPGDTGVWEALPFTVQPNDITSPGLVVAVSIALKSVEFLVTGTSDEDATVTLLASETSVTPADSLFDASPDNASAVQGEEWVIAHPGFFYTDTVWAHIRLEDAAGNKSYFKRQVIAADGGGGGAKLSPRARRVVAAR